jgi:hypothetical protein
MEETSMKIIQTSRIWDQARHNAFTDLVRFNDCFYCAFREGESHVSDDGVLRLIRSHDGKDWEPVAVMAWQEGDVRDAKLSITARGELMLNGAVRFLKAADGRQHQSVTWLSTDGLNWSDPYACPSGLGTWRWSVTWHEGYGYSFAYSGKDVNGCLYRTADGKTWQVWRDEVYPQVEAYPNEASLVFSKDGTAYCLLRRDEGSGSALLGAATEPYQDWQWQDLGVQIGGPKMIQLRDGRFLAAVRLYDGQVRTSLCWVDPAASRIEEALALPSGGDTSYAGMVEHEGVVWVSYYSSHEDKTAIYLALVRV